VDFKSDPALFNAHSGPFPGVVLLVHRTDVSAGPASAPGVMNLVGQALPPCKDKTLDYRFRNAPRAPGFCTGFLTKLSSGETVIATARHCLGANMCPGHQPMCTSQWRAVFGFDDTAPNHGETIQLPAYSTFPIAGLSPASPEDGSDLMLLSLAEPVPPETALPFTIDRTGLDTAAAGASVILVGHPNGLPKLIDGGEPIVLTDVPDHPHNRYIAVDAYGGHSGSPLFRLDDGVAVGMLVSGESDYEVQPAANGQPACLHTLRTTTLADARETALGLNGIP
jgi:hypothetical protein